MSLSCSPRSLQVPLPELVRAARRGRRALLQRVRNAPLSEAVSSAARTGNLRCPPFLGCGTPDACLLPLRVHLLWVHLLSFIHQTALGHREAQSFCWIHLFSSVWSLCFSPVPYAKDSDNEDIARVPALRALIFLKVRWQWTQRTVGENVCVSDSTADECDR